MAKVQFGAGITAISGSIGGWTFHTNRSGNIVRLRSGTPKRTTPKQDNAISKHVQFLAAFQALNQPEKDAWNLFAEANPKVDKFGVTKILTGQNWFESVNQNRDFFSLSLLNNPPLPTLPDGNTNYSVNLTSTAITITKLDPINPVDTGLLIRSTAPFTRTTESFRSNLRFTLVKGTGPFTPFDMTAEWQLAHGCSYPPSTGNVNFNIGIMLQTVNLNTGITSPGNVQFDTLTIPNTGIGFLEIGVDFEVS